MRRVIFLFAFLLLFIAATPNTEARVTRLEVLLRSDVLGGKSFGLAGPYEKLIGRVYFNVNPQNPHNVTIVDLDKAERNETGAVEFSADFYILKPAVG